MALSTPIVPPGRLDKISNSKVSKNSFAAALGGYALMLSLPTLADLAAQQAGQYSSVAFVATAAVLDLAIMLALLLGSANAPTPRINRIRGIVLAAAFGLTSALVVAAYVASSQFGVINELFSPLLQYTVGLGLFYMCWATAVAAPRRSLVLLPIILGFYCLRPVGGLFAYSSLFFVVGDLLMLAILTFSFTLLRRQRALSSQPRRAANGGNPGAEGHVSTPTRTNTLALLALIFGILSSSLVAIILGHLARGQIKRAGEQGWGMATAGLVLGYVWLVVGVILLAVYVGVVMAPLWALQSYY